MITLKMNDKTYAFNTDDAAYLFYHMKTVEEKKKVFQVIKPNLDCRYCHGSGQVDERHPYGSTTAVESFDCDCVTEQMICEEIEIEIDDSEYREYLREYCYDQYTDEFSHLT